MILPQQQRYSLLTLMYIYTNVLKSKKQYRQVIVIQGKKSMYSLDKALLFVHFLHVLQETQIKESIIYTTWHRACPYPPHYDAPLFLFAILTSLFQRGSMKRTLIPPFPVIANFSMKYFILSKVYTDKGGIKYT